jgi:uncharacterized protein (DUF849 family)
MAKLAWRYADSFEFMEQTRAGFPPAMICVACNGGIQGKETHDGLPESPDMGGHARVGLEDNLYRSRGRKFADNAGAVQRVVRIAGELNRRISTPAQTRKLLGLPAVPLNISSQRTTS